ncbi:MAG: hypothetical protein HOO86_05575 [Bacteroidales bacterium]|nr:hypothetical protein [Bacteroidales bacterium]
MKQAICIIDDYLPVEKFPDFMDSREIINKNNFKHLLTLDSEGWEDKNLFNLVSDILKHAEFELSGFTSHEGFLIYSEENMFSPLVIIFDWNISGQTVDSKDTLKEILKKKHCLIAIYTESDNIPEIQKLIESDEYNQYKERLFLFEKKSEGSARILQEKINKSIVENFSFKFSQDLKMKNLNALDSVLTLISKFSFDEFISLFGEKEDQKSKLSALDFVDIITDKTKSNLISSGYTEDIIANYIKTEDQNLVRKLWHFRLYHKPQDQIVRKGDIIKEAASQRLYMVISSDCHLKKFWQKNFGHLVIVPIYKFDDPIIKTKILTFTKSEARKKFTLSSMNNPNAIENITFLPGLFHEVDQFIDYIISPKEITSIEIVKPDALNPKSQLEYTQFPAFIGVNRLRLSEPFLTPLVEYLLKNVTDNGVPDYSDLLKDSLKKNITDLN